jgi:hypothetical protein
MLAQINLFLLQSARSFACFLEENLPLFVVLVLTGFIFVAFKK